MFFQDHNSTLTMLQVDDVKNYDGSSSGAVNVAQALRGFEEIFPE